MGGHSRWEIFVTQPILPEGREILERVGTVRENPYDRPLTEEDMIELASAADAFVGTFAEPYRVFSARVIEASKNLKVIGWNGVGFDHIDLGAATERGIYVTYVDLQCPTVADQAFALILCAAKRLISACEAVRSGRWEDEGLFLNLNFVGRDVHHTTLGIAGLGRIGEAVARRAKGFDMRVIYYDQVSRSALEQELGVVPVSFDTLLRESDYLSCNLPLNSHTRKLFGAGEFSRMKRSCIFVNTGRGGVVDTDALYEALRTGQIEMAALDVIDPEPLPSDHPILKLNNLILAPHIAGLTRETRSRQHVWVANDTVRVLNGIRPLKLLNPEVLRVRPLGEEPTAS
jgi:glyoxylate reductase